MSNVFKIESPHVSPGMKLTHGKKIEIWEIRETENSGWTNHQLVRRQWYTANGWMEEELQEDTDGPRTICSEVQTQPIRGDYYFNSFELAYVSKIILLQNMIEEYERELVKARAKLARNVPDVKSHMAEIRENLPEYLI